MSGAQNRPCSHKYRAHCYRWVLSFTLRKAVYGQVSLIDETPFNRYARAGYERARDGELGETVSVTVRPPAAQASYPATGLVAHHLSEDYALRSLSRELPLRL